MLLSYKFKLPGLILILAGTGLTVLYFGFDFRFEMPVLAVFSSFMETRFFTTFRTNFADELIILLFLSGFCLVVFSKEKYEREILREIRIKAIYKTIAIDILLLVLTTLFVFGGGFMAFTIINLILPFLLYLILFNIMKFKALKQTVRK